MTEATITDSFAIGVMAGAFCWIAIALWRIGSALKRMVPPGR